MRKSYLVGALLAAALPLMAASLDLADFGFVKTGDRMVGGKDLPVYSDGSGGSVVLDAQAEPSPERAKSLRSLVSELRSWRGIQAGDIVAVNSAESLDLTIVPTSFSAEGVSLTGAIPGGILISLAGAPEYSFKVLSGRFVVAVRSVYTTEAEMESAALAAFKDPVFFQEMRDPTYLQARLAEVDELKAALQAQKARNDELAASLAMAKAAAAAALNGGKPVKPDLESKIVELKKGEPSLDKAAIAAKLKTAGIKASMAEISAVLAVDFSEY